MHFDAPYAIQMAEEMRESNILCFIGHGTDAGICFYHDNADYYSVYSKFVANQRVLNGYNKEKDASVMGYYQINELSSVRLVLYIGCYTGKDYTPAGTTTTYNLVDETYKKGAHCVIGAEGLVTLPRCNEWVKTFFQHARDGWCIKDCINYADRLISDSGLKDKLYIMGDVKQRLDQ